MSVNEGISVFECLETAKSDDVLRIALSNNVTLKVKVAEVYDNGVAVFDEDGAVFAIPFTAIVSIRDVTDNPAFTWKGK